MGTYKLSKEGFQKIKKKLLFQALIITIIPIGLFFVAISSLDTKITLPILLILLILGTGREYFQVRKREKEWTSFTITINENSLIRTQIKSNSTVINFDEMIRLVEIPSSGLSVQTSNPSKNIYIPIHLEGYDEVKEQLMKIKPLEISPVGVNNPAITALASIEPKKSIAKVIFSTLFSTIAPFVIFLLILLVVIFIFADFS